MNFRLTTYFTFSGKKEILELPDSSYGQWIIYEKNSPTYYIDIFNKTIDSNNIISDLISDHTETIETIIKKINHYKELNLKLEKAPLLRFVIDSKIKNLELKQIPKDWIVNIKNENSK